MISRWRAAAGIAAALAAIPGCGTEAPAKPPAAAAAVYVPRLPEFEALAATLVVPDEDKLAELRDLVATAYGANADVRLAEMAARRLEREEFERFALEDGLASIDALQRANCAWRLRERGDAASTAPLLARMFGELDCAANLYEAAALLALGNNSPMVVRAVRDSLDIPMLARDAYDCGLAAVRAADPSVEAGASIKEVRAGLDRLEAHWVRHGYALGRPAPDPAALDPRLRARFARHLAALVGFELRPVDVGRVVLRSSGVLGLPLLKAALTAEEPYLRSHSVEIVRDIGRPAAPLEPEIVALLDDPANRLAATEAAGTIRAGSAIAALRARLADPDVDLAAAAARALGDARAGEARGDLAAILADGARPLDLRVYAAYALARLDPGRAFLDDLAERDAYHAPTLRELLESLGKR